MRDYQESVTIGQADAHTDRRQTKWSLCAAMLRRRHNKPSFQKKKKSLVSILFCNYFIIHFDENNPGNSQIRFFGRINVWNAHSNVEPKGCSWVLNSVKYTVLHESVEIDDDSSDVKM